VPGPLPTLSGDSDTWEFVAARSPLAVIWSGLVVVKLLRYRLTINDHAAHDSHRRDDRGDQSGERHTNGSSPFGRRPLSRRAVFAVMPRATRWSPLPSSRIIPPASHDASACGRCPLARRPRATPSSGVRSRSSARAPRVTGAFSHQGPRPDPDGCAHRRSARRGSCPTMGASRLRHSTEAYACPPVMPK